MPHPFFLAQARRLLAVLLAGGLPYALAAEPVSPPAAPTEAVARSGHATYHQGVAAAIAPLLAQPLTLDAASRIGLLNSPQTQQVWADFGITPHDLLLAGVLKLPAPLALQRDVLGIGQGAAARYQQDFRTALAKQLEGIRQAWLTAAAAEHKRALFQDIALAGEAAGDLASGQRKVGNTGAAHALPILLEQYRLASDRDKAEAEALASRGALAAALGLDPQHTSALRLATLPALPRQLPALSAMLAVAQQQRADWLSARAAQRREAPLGGVLAESRAHFTLPLLTQNNAFRRSVAVRESDLTAQAVSAKGVAEVQGSHAHLVAAHARASRYQDHLLPLHAQHVGELFKLYNGMLIGTFELLESRRKELEAQAEATDALQDFWLRWLALEAAVGGEVPLLTASATAVTPAPAPAPTEDSKATGKAEQKGAAATASPAAAPTASPRDQAAPLVPPLPRLPAAKPATGNAHAGH